MRFLSALLISSVLLAGCAEFHWITPEPGDVVVLPTVTPTPEPPPLPTIEPEVVPEEEVGESTPVPPEALIKGNISSSGEKIYHMPDGAYYDQVKIDESKGEMWFRSEEDAIAAGWRKSSR